MEQTIAGGSNVCEHLDVGGPPTPGVSQYVEVSQQRLAIGGDRHNPAPLTTASQVLRAVESLREVQVQLVSPRLQRNGIREIALAAGAMDGRVLCTPDVLDGTSDWSAA